MNSQAYKYCSQPLDPSTRKILDEAPHHIRSYYADTGLPHKDRIPLRGTTFADVCIVGGGYTGLSSALHLVEAGYKVIVLEAARVGWGASGRNGGQIVHSYSRDMDWIEAHVGARAAVGLGRMAFEGARIIKERIAKYGIDCDLQPGGLFTSLTDKQTAKLHRHKALWERYGHDDLTLLDAAQTEAATGSPRYVASLLDGSAGHIHPLRLAQGEADAVEAAGGIIHEGSAVTRVKRGSMVTVQTALGEVQARFAIIACNAYIGDLEPRLAAHSMPCGTQIIASEPLGERHPEILPTRLCVEDSNFLLDYFRLSSDRRLIYGGGVVYGAQDPLHIESVIRPKLIKTFPQLKDVRIDYAWSGNFLLTLNRLPEVGRLSDNIYYSHGCSGHGVTFTHLIGRVLSEVIRGQSERFDVFADLPHYPFPGGRLLRVPLTALGAFYYDLRDRLGV